MGDPCSVPEASICGIYRSRRSDGGARTEIEVVVFRGVLLGRVSAAAWRGEFDRRCSLFVPIRKSVRCRPSGRHIIPTCSNRRWSHGATSGLVTRVERCSHPAAISGLLLMMSNWTNWGELGRRTCSWKSLTRRYCTWTVYDVRAIIGRWKGRAQRHDL